MCVCRAWVSAYHKSSVARRHIHPNAPHSASRTPATSNRSCPGHAMPERQAIPQGAKGCAVCGVRSRFFRCSKGGGPKVPPDLSGNRTLPRLHPRAPYPLRASLSTRTAMMINVPSFPNTQGHQDSPVVSLAFVGVPLPTDPQAVQERATPLGACGSGRPLIVRRRVFAGFPPRLGLARSSIDGWHENPSSRHLVMGRASPSALALSFRVRLRLRLRRLPRRGAA